MMFYLHSLVRPFDRLMVNGVEDLVKSGLLTPNAIFPHKLKGKSMRVEIAERLLSEKKFGRAIANLKDSPKGTKSSNYLEYFPEI